MAFARMYLGVHYLPDVAGGFLVRSAALLVADLLQLPPLRARLDGLDRGSGTGRHAVRAARTPARNR